MSGCHTECRAYDVCYGCLPFTQSLRLPPVCQPACLPACLPVCLPGGRLSLGGFYHFCPLLSPHAVLLDRPYSLVGQDLSCVTCRSLLVAWAVLLVAVICSFVRLPHGRHLSILTRFPISLQFVTALSAPFFPSTRFRTLTLEALEQHHVGFNGFSLALVGNIE